MYIETLRGLGPKAVIWVSLEESCCAVARAPKRSVAVRESMVKGIGSDLLLLGFSSIECWRLSWVLYSSDLRVLYASGTAIFLFNPGLERMSCRVDGMVVQVSA